MCSLFGLAYHIYRSTSCKSQGHTRRTPLQEPPPPFSCVRCLPARLLACLLACLPARLLACSVCRAQGIFQECLFDNRFTAWLTSMLDFPRSVTRCAPFTSMLGKVHSWVCVLSSLTPPLVHDFAHASVFMRLCVCVFVLNVHVCMAFPKRFGVCASASLRVRLCGVPYKRH